MMGGGGGGEADGGGAVDDGAAETGDAMGSGVGEESTEGFAAANNAPEIPSSSSSNMSTDNFGEDGMAEQQFNDFADDNTTFSTESSFGSDSNSDDWASSSDSFDNVVEDAAEEGVGGILGTIWDLFNDNN